MSVLAGFNLRRSVLSTSPKSNQTIITTTCDLFFVYMNSRIQWFSSSSDSTGDEFSGGNAYDLLGVSETSSFAEIKAAFRKLAKETHPDLTGLKNASSASQRFVQILAAYEILSDIEKRAHYDRFLLSQRTLVHKSSRQGSKLYAYESHITTVRQMEVVEWLKWYRLTINDILLEKKVVVGSSYFDALEGEFYSAVRAAYYGPVIESWDLLPDRFEAEERSEYETPEVLHLVSGRDLFGMVCLVNKHPKLSYICNEKLTSSAYMGSDMSRCVGNASQCMNSNVVDDVRISQMQAKNFQYPISEAYKDLELHLSGRVVAVATRVPPKNSSDVLQNDESLDHIHVFLNSNEDPIYIDKEFSKDSSLGGGSRVPLGTITGLGTCPDEGSCFVYNSSGAKTHVLMKHRTLLVKHMHWYQVGNKVSVCECRCSRARLPPSKSVHKILIKGNRDEDKHYKMRFWLFEPRCGMHDIGGWYIETFGKDKKGWNIPSRRYWDGFDAHGEAEKRLHPAMYLLALAYRTLDLEEEKRRKLTMRGIIEGNLFRILRWCKKLI